MEPPPIPVTSQNAIFYPAVAGCSGGLDRPDERVKHPSLISWPNPSELVQVFKFLSLLGLVLVKYLWLDLQNGLCSKFLREYKHQQSLRLTTNLHVRAN